MGRIGISTTSALQQSITPIERNYFMSRETQDASLLLQLKQIDGLKLKIAEPLARYTSMKVGGPADYFIEAESEAALAKLLQLLDQYQEPYWLLGNGSNVLISDRGVRGAILRLAGEFKRVQWDEAGASVKVTAGAAVPIAQLARDAARRGFADLEFAEGIPGSIGGAVYMNAGAYGSEIETIIDHVQMMTPLGAALWVSRAEMTFSYRDSHLSFGTVVMRVRLSLRKQEAPEVSARLREFARKRKASQPTGFPNSGSMFRNPPGDYAGRLIEAAGLKGKRLGSCQISERHGNFIVNHGGTTAMEVYQLMNLAKSEVHKRFGIELVPEVKLLGNWESN